MSVRTSVRMSERKLLAFLPLTFLPVKAVLLPGSKNK